MSQSGLPEVESSCAVDRRKRRLVGSPFGANHGEAVFVFVGLRYFKATPTLHTRHVQHDHCPVLRAADEVLVVRRQTQFGGGHSHGTRVQFVFKASTHLLPHPQVPETND